MKRRSDPHDRAKEAAEHARPRTAANTKINAGYYYLFSAHSIASAPSNVYDGFSALGMRSCVVDADAT